MESFANGHTGIERDLVWYVGEEALNLNFMLGRIKIENADFSGLRTKQIEQTLHGGGLAGAVTAEESIAAPGLNGERQVVNGFIAAVSVGKIFDLNGWSGRGHCLFVL